MPVVLGTNDSTAEVCSGRFYVGVNVGAEFGKMKYTQKPGDQYDVVPDGIAKLSDLATEWPHKENLTEVFPLPNLPVNVKLPVFPKKKLCFTGELIVGYIFELKSFGIGLNLGFGKRFGTVKETIQSKLQTYMSSEQAGAIGVTPLTGDGDAWDYNMVNKYRRVMKPSEYEKAVRYNTKDVTEIKLKNKFNVTITPIIEYKANSMFGIYITGGIRISNDKVTYKETDGSTKKVTNFKKTKTSIAPVVGGGVMINLTDHMYAKVQYLYQFGSKIKKTISRKINDKKNEVTPTVKYRSQKVTVGFGYMF